MTAARGCHGERGFSLIEMIVSLVMFGVIAGAALTIFRQQSGVFRMGADRAAALQNSRFAGEQLVRDLRTVGTGTTDQQPFLVYAGPDVVAFNANEVSNVAGDVFAVYYDPDAPAGTVTALRTTGRITIPNTGVTYPDSNYWNGAVLSSAETIVLFFRPDSSTTRSDDYALFRQANREAPELVARNLLQTGSTPFFRYYQLSSPVGAVASIVVVPDGSLPLRHTPPIHLGQNDTGAVARIDSIRGVEVAFTATNGLSGADERRRDYTRLIRMPNAGLAQKKSCGDQPLLGTTLTATPITLPSGGPAVTLTWGRATDESGGELDVVRYVIWRRVAGASDWGDGFVSVPSGLGAYTYEDQAVQSGQVLEYALAAQDCTPSLSSLSAAAPVTIP